MTRTPTLFDDVTVHNGEAHFQTQDSDGYKRDRHVGPIPKAWQVRRLRELVDELTAGVSVGGENRSLAENEIGVLRVSSVTSGIFKPNKCKVVDPDDYGRLRTQPKAGSILLNRANGTLDLVGISVYIKENYPNLYLSDKLWRIIPNSQTVEATRWLNLLLNTGAVRAKIREYASGKSTGMKNVTQKDFLSIPAPVPPPEEQRRIANILSTWDRAIEQVDALIEAKRERLHGLRQRLLTGQVRFPEFDEPWKEVKLGEVTRELRNRNEGRYDEDRVYGVKNTEGLTPSTDRSPSNDISKYKIVPQNGFAYNPMRLDVGSIGRLFDPGPVLVSRDYIVFECKSDHLDPAYLDHYRKTRHWEHFVESTGSGSVRVRVYYRHLKRMKLRLPPLPEQRKIASTLGTAKTEIRQLEAKRDALKRQKKGLMQRLLTGRVRTV